MTGHRKVARNGDADLRGYLPYLRALILLQCDDAAPPALLYRAGFTVEEVAELCDMRVAAVRKAIQRARVGA